MVRRQMTGETWRKVLGAFIVFAIFALAVDTFADGVSLNFEPRQGQGEGSTAGGYKITMCVGQENGHTGPCDDVGDGTGEVIVHRFNGAYTFTLYGTQSTDAYNCDFYSNDTGYDADAADVQVMNDDSLTETNQSISFAGPMDYGWVECDAITDTVIITMVVLPLSIPYF